MPIIFFISDLGICGGSSISQAIFKVQLLFFQEIVMILGVPFKGFVSSKGIIILGSFLPLH